MRMKMVRMIIRPFLTQNDFLGFFFFADEGVRTVVSLAAWGGGETGEGGAAAESLGESALSVAAVTSGVR